MQLGARSERGRSRQTNEDAYVASLLGEGKDVYLLAVADGMGGYVAGEVASETAVSALRNSLSRACEDGSLSQSLSAATLRAFQAANQAVLDAAKSCQGHRGMGTTLTAVVALKNRVCVGHVGDSRAYVLSEGYFRAVTQDHSLVGELVRNGGLSEEEALSHPQRNVLTRALGSSPDALIDVVELDLSEPYTIILLTDGITGLLTSAEIEDSVRSAKDPEVLARSLTDMAMARGGHDDATCVIASRTATTGGEDA